MLQKYNFNKAERIRSFCISLLLLAAMPVWAQGQLPDKIYLANETSVGNIEIVEISKRKIRARNQEGKELTFKVKEALMAFNGNGHYIIFPAKPEKLKSFLSEGKKNADADLIVSFPAEVIPARINSESGAEINYQAVGSNEGNKNLPTTGIAAIIYKDGTHKLFASPSRVSEVLAQLQEQVQEARLASYTNTEKKEVNPFSSDKPDNRQASAKNEPAGVKKEEKLEASIEIDPEIYSRKALQKTADLGTYLGIISDRSNSAGEANKAVELAVKLFIDENAEVEVSSKEGRERYKVRAYLNRLKLLNYDKVEISWTDISYVSDLKKGIDGNYYGVITLQQRFKGFKDNQVVYGDITEKNIEVMMVPYQKETDGEQQQKWDVFLSDVGVVVTKFDQ